MHDYVKLLDDAVLRSHAEYRSLQLALKTYKDAFSRFVPRNFFSLLKTEDGTVVHAGDHTELKLSILFVDVRNFTALAEEMAPDDVLRLLNSFNSKFEGPIYSNQGFIDKFIGDGMMVIFTSADSAVRSAVSMMQMVHEFNRDRAQQKLSPVWLSMGIHTGYSTLGVQGASQRTELTVIGDAVNVASRVQNLTSQLQSRLLISESTQLHLSDNDLFLNRFIDRIQVRGRIRPISVYEVFEADDEETRKAKLAGQELFDHAICAFHMGHYGEAAQLLNKYSAINETDPVANMYRKRCEIHLGVEEIREEPEKINDTFRWIPEYDTGHGVIDEHHHELVGTYEKLKAAVASRKEEELDNVLRFLHSYSRFHFSTEAELMKSANYPLLPDHLEEHKAFVRKLDILDRELRTGTHEFTLLFHLNLLLFDWLAVHSSKVDKHFVRWLARQS